MSGSDDIIGTHHSTDGVVPPKSE